MLHPEFNFTKGTKLPVQKRKRKPFFLVLSNLSRRPSTYPYLERLNVRCRIFITRFFKPINSLVTSLLSFSFPPRHSHKDLDYLIIFQRQAELLEWK